MILDKGICSIFSVGGTPLSPTYTLKYQSWYGELNFETAPIYPTESREAVEITARVRIHQNRFINNKDVLLYGQISAVRADSEKYEITRAFHGIDDENNQPITDLTLRRVV